MCSARTSTRSPTAAGSTAPRRDGGPRRAARLARVGCAARLATSSSSTGPTRRAPASAAACSAARPSRATSTSRWCGGCTDGDGSRPAGGAGRERRRARPDRRGPQAPAEGLGAYLELHIEQGPVMEGRGNAGRGGRPAASASSARASSSAARPRTPGRRRWTAAATPGLRPPRPHWRSSGSPSARAASRRRARWSCARASSPRSPGGRSSRVTCETPRPERWRRCWRPPATPPATAAKHRGCELREELIWRIAPTPFDPDLVGTRVAVAAELGGREDAIDQRRPARRRRGRAGDSRRR